MAPLESLGEARPATPKRSRNTKRASLACAACKRSKRRCDIEQQVLDSDACTNCKDKGELCELRLGEDKRRKKPALSNIDYGSRLEALERVLSAQSRSDSRPQRSIVFDHNQEPPSRREPQSTHEHETATVQVSANSAPTQGIPWPSAEPAGAATVVDGTSTSPRAIGFVQPRDNRGQFAKSASSNTVPPEPAILQQAVSPPVSAPTPNSSTATNVSNAIMSKVIAMEGGLEDQANEGSEYFGATSIYHVSNQARSERDRQSLLSQSHTRPAQSMVNIPADLDTTNEPEPVISHLLDLFWTWQAIHLQVFHRELFLAEKSRYDLQRPRRRYSFFSPSLLYSVMALSSMISPERGVRYQSMHAGGVPGDIYFEKAKKLFEQEIEFPAITTVQTALLLGSRYGSVGQSSLGWLYSGKFYG